MASCSDFCAWDHEELQSLKLGTRWTDWMDLKGIDWQVVILGKISSRQEDAACGYAYSLAILTYPEHRSKVSMRNFLLLLSPAGLECHLVQLNLSAWNIQLAFSANEVIINLKTTGISPDWCCPSRPPSAIYFWLLLIVYLYILGLINTNWLSENAAQCPVLSVLSLTVTGCI